MDAARVFALLERPALTTLFVGHSGTSGSNLLPESSRAPPPRRHPKALNSSCTGTHPGVRGLAPKRVERMAGNRASRRFKRAILLRRRADVRVDCLEAISR
jgi:hypothetical protein